MSRKPTVARSVVIASMIACYGALAVAAAQFHFYGIRAEGGAGNAIVFATMTCLAASISLAGIFTMDRVFAGPLFGAFISGGIAVLYSGSRITWGALFLAAVVILFVHRENLRARISRRTALYAVLAIGALTIVGSLTIPPRVDALVQDWRQMSLDGNYDSSVGRRAALWQIGIEAVRDSPVVGYGPQSMERLINERFRDKTGLEVYYGHFHNGFLTAWVETGLLGAISLAAIFVIAARNAARRLSASGDPTERLGAAILLVLVTTYVASGLSGILVGHDILDSALMGFLVVGTFLSSGTSLLDEQTEAA
jgi:O-antigen ligase